MRVVIVCSLFLFVSCIGKCIKLIKKEKGEVNDERDEHAMYCQFRLGNITFKIKRTCNLF